jgi:hypothetical protein
MLSQYLPKRIVVPRVGMKNVLDRRDESVDKVCLGRVRVWPKQQRNNKLLSTFIVAIVTILKTKHFCPIQDTYMSDV